MVCELSALRVDLESEKSKHNATKTERNDMKASLIEEQSQHQATKNELLKEKDDHFVTMNKLDQESRNEPKTFFKISF